MSDAQKLKAISRAIKGKRVILSCDTGLDDGWLLAALLKLGVKLEAVVASYGNTTVEHAVSNTSALLRLAGREDIPIILGPAGPTVKNHISPDERFGGDNGFMNIKLKPGKNPIIDGTDGEKAGAVCRYLAKGGELTFINSGPATFVASLEHFFPGAFSRYVTQTLIMGCAPYGDGCVGTKRPHSSIGCAEFNAFHDPAAMRTLLSLAESCPKRTRLVTWESRGVVLPKRLVEQLKASDRLGSALLRATKAFFRMYTTDTFTSFEPEYGIFDLPLAFALAEDFGSWRQDGVSIVTSGKYYGRTRSAELGAKVEVYYKTDNEAAAQLALKLLGLTVKTTVKTTVKNVTSKK